MVDQAPWIKLNQTNKTLHQKHIKINKKTKTQKQTQNIEATQTWWNVLLSWGKQKTKNCGYIDKRVLLFDEATRLLYKVNDTCDVSQWQCWQRDFKILSGESRTKTLYSDRNCFHCLQMNNERWQSRSQQGGRSLLFHFYLSRPFYLPPPHLNSH